MRIIINNSSMVPIYEQLANQIKEGIINKSIQSGELLPSVRTMALDLKISSLTVKKAYDALEEEGFVTTVHGKGTYVNETNRQIAIEARRKAIEDDLSFVIDKAISSGLNKQEIQEVVSILLEEKDD